MFTIPFAAEGDAMIESSIRPNVVKIHWTSARILYAPAHAPVPAVNEQNKQKKIEWNMPLINATNSEAK